jgi:hypothetical protein
MNIRVKALFIIAAIAYTISSCKKNDDAPQVTETTNLNVVNTSLNTINYFINGTRINNTTSYYPGGTLGYVPVLAGTQNYQIKIKGNTDPLFTRSLTFDAGKYYSLYVAGSTADDAFFTNDVLTADTLGNALVRFVNASPDSGPLVVAFEGGSLATTVLDTVKFNNVTYKTTTDFIQVKGGFVHNVSVYRASSPLNPKRDTTVTLNAGQIYTIYSYGLVSSAGNQGLSTRLIVNQ